MYYQLKTTITWSKIYDNDTHRVYFNDMQLPLYAGQVRWMHDKYWVDESVIRIISLKLVCAY